MSTRSRNMKRQRCMSLLRMGQTPQVKWQVASGMCSRLQTETGCAVARGAQGDNFAKRLEKYHFTPTRNDGENEANEASDMK